MLGSLAFLLAFSISAWKRKGNGSYAGLMEQLIFDANISLNVSKRNIATDPG